ncbi:hypothetical protein [Hymenobacter sp. GOD-10R]|uniref:hypothetical protein n=1 Tax=Hymenobacter sp. GOD-10R TaxID=3093922 RepID=UPI002D7A04BB|nr:hypothetical protein [Hymenobacter sp. GOD-10R]WRQ29369.1 hypothetical protein SD425_03710 [Hymenobacter sp. GOD-10R]
MAETPESYLKFIEDYPSYLGLLTYVETLAKNKPEVFESPPDEAIIDALASMLATRLYLAAYVMGGLRFIHEVELEFLRLGKQQEVDAIIQMLKANALFMVNDSGNTNTDSASGE